MVNKINIKSYFEVKCALLLNRNEYQFTLGDIELNVIRWYNIIAIVAVSKITFRSTLQKFGSKMIILL